MLVVPVMCIKRLVTLLSLRRVRRPDIARLAPAAKRPRPDRLQRVLAVRLAVIVGLAGRLPPPVNAITEVAGPHIPLVRRVAMLLGVLRVRLPSPSLRSPKLAIA